MATLTLAHCLHNSSCSFQELKTRNCQRILVVVSCQRGQPAEDYNPTPKSKSEIKQDKRLFRQLLGRVDKFGKGLRNNLSPRQKGDWKDVVLMSLSFAVYVYISQQIVCAYCAWMSMLKHSW
ncbi:hypothetical protein Tsubulata_000561 [Turnera subulata]|uniref:Uncharacterized protein n=1 Tax=Turnera subulata TaxID=218843 RepID=A0A9Q0J9G3_9ROSI|nr:hypothetical protein Tsubulata_000561 [Turnera subulata]